MDWLTAFWASCDLNTNFKALMGQLKGPGRTWAIAHSALTIKRPLCVVCEDAQTALQLEEECQFFLDQNPIPVLSFPDYETLPFDHFSPHQSIISDRLSTLSKLPRSKQGIIITTMSALLQRLPPQHFIDAHYFVLKRGDHFDPHKLRSQFEKAGYLAVQEVFGHGEYSIRGCIVDVFPMGTKQPFRLDLFDNEIESIRLFDPETQRSLQEIDEINCLPAHELSLNPESINQFKQHWKDIFKDRYQDSSVLEAVSSGRIPPGVEYYLPFFHKEMATLLDYLPHNTAMIYVGDPHTQASHVWKSIQDCFYAHQFDMHYPALPPEKVFIPIEKLFETSKAFIQISLLDTPLNKTASLRLNAPSQELPLLSIDAKSKTPYERLSFFMASNPKAAIVFTADSEGRCSILQEHLNRTGHSVKRLETLTVGKPVPPGIYTKVAPFIDGSYIEYNTHHPLFIISELLLFSHTQHRHRRGKTVKSFDENQTFIRDITELNVGDPVVHIDHGVGRYAGLSHLDIGVQTEFVTLEYEHGDKLYVPVSDLSCIARYSSARAESAPLDRLGSDRFAKAKEKAAKRIRDVAAELLAIYAQREAKPGFSFQAEAQDYQLFAEAFPFELTQDQEKAIEAVIADMKRPKPMDRLLCGDVGFGKTEVALRAAFICIQSGRQAVLLAPTTLLVEQHFEVFSNRFANWPIKVAAISRFKTAKELKVTLDQCASGQIDMIIGTHKLLSDQVKFHNLGLVVIDEEHRFGVRHKEKLKSMRAEVDILTMTATPIPRTLNMAFSELRDLSIIATPPAKRLSVHTFIKEKSDELLVEAISREVHRGGQIYYLHNNVESIHRCQEELQALIPSIKTGVAHGQMKESELAPVMSQFYHNQFQVLICTTIIETGLDIPNANTIIIDRADRLGLAQLHQLRGRVGRSHRQAYAYLLTPPFNILTRDAQKRLEAIESASDLGAGFTLASFDLEIRGAGELLGDGQSGHMQSIGLTLYFELLSRTVKAMKQNRSLDLEVLLENTHAQIELGISSMLPEDYVSDIPTRLQFYHRLSRCDQEDRLEKIIAEIIDRFGLPPEPAENLFEQTRLRLVCEAMGIKKIEISHKQIKIRFGGDPKIDAIRLIKMVQSSANQYQLHGQHTLLMQKVSPDTRELLKSVFSTLDKIRVL